MNDQRRTRQQLKAQLLRLGYKYTGKTSWNPAHERYLRELVLPHAAHKVVVEEYLQTIGTAGERVARLTGQIETLAKEWRLWPAIQALMSMRGFQVLSATLFLSELGDLERFPHPRHLMAYLGLLPSEHSSGDTVRTGSITKCGNGHVRWILIEAAQHYFHPPKVSQELSRRQQNQPRRLKEISWRAQNRLYRRSRALLARGKSRQKTVTARPPCDLPCPFRLLGRGARTGRLPLGALPRVGAPWASPGAGGPPRGGADRDLRIGEENRSAAIIHWGLLDSAQRAALPPGPAGAPRAEGAGSGGTRSHR